jgi:hypothetical protein
MNSKTLNVVDMKSEFEFSGVYLYFIRQYVIPSALQRDSEKSEISRLIRQTHRDLVIAD